MISRILFILSIAIFSLTVSSCGNDADCSDEVAINNALSSGFNDVANASQAYINDQSDANCNNLKDAYNDWIDDLDDFQGCADEVGQGQEFRDAINSARDDRDDLGC